MVSKGYPGENVLNFKKGRLDGLVVEQLVGFVITDEGVFVTFGCQGRVELDAGVFEGTAAQH